jgi:hypothetical protein
MLNTVGFESPKGESCFARAMLAREQWWGYQREMAEGMVATQSIPALIVPRAAAAAVLLLGGGGGGSGSVNSSSSDNGSVSVLLTVKCEMYHRPDTS